MPKTALRIGPRDHGRRMRLADFDHADVQEGYLYELSRGVITVSDVPNRRHLLQVEAAREQLYAYRLAHPGRIRAILSGSECRILIGELESERHPDLSVYTTPPPPNGEDMGSVWLPAVVVEVVSPRSRDRDYGEKLEEYLRAGIREYWILDADEQQMLALRRRGGRWVERVVRPPQVYRTRLLPGFAFACAAVFAAAAAAGE